jgi:hypothetical protein
MKHHTKNVFGAWNPVAICKVQVKRASLTSLEHAGLTEIFLATCKKTKYTGMLRACSRQLVTCRRYQTLLQQLVASLLVSSTLFQDDNNLFQTCQQLGTRNTNTSC